MLRQFRAVMALRDAQHFTDGWQHDVHLEQILLLKAGRVYPRCVGGRRRVPPEDCGGP